MTEHDLLNNALVLLALAFRAADEGRFAAARGLSANAAKYFEDAEIIAGLQIDALGASATRSRSTFSASRITARTAGMAAASSSGGSQSERACVGGHGGRS